MMIDARYRWGEQRASAVADAQTSLGAQFTWDGGRAPATFRRAERETVLPALRDATTPMLPDEALTLRATEPLSESDFAQIVLLVNVLNLFNVDAKRRGIKTSTRSAHFSFRTTPPDYSQPELIPPAS